MSKELITGIVDAVVSLIAFFIGKAFAPDIVSEIMYVILLLQPVVLAILLHFFTETLSIKIAARIR